MKKKLYKSEKNKMICGVCGGIAEFFGCDPTIIRLLAIILCLLKGFGLLMYVLAAIVIPRSDGVSMENEDEDDVESMKSANIDSSEKETEKSNENHSNGKTPHSDEEFDSFFKKSK